MYYLVNVVNTASIEFLTVWLMEKLLGIISYKRTTCCAYISVNPQMVRRASNKTTLGTDKRWS